MIIMFKHPLSWSPKLVVPEIASHPPLSSRLYPWLQRPWLHFSTNSSLICCQTSFLQLSSSLPSRQPSAPSSQMDIQALHLLTPLLRNKQNWELGFSRGEVKVESVCCHVFFISWLVTHVLIQDYFYPSFLVQTLQAQWKQHWILSATRNATTT